MTKEEFRSWPEIARDPQYRSFKRTNRRIVIPLLAAFVVIYAAYVFSAIYAADAVSRLHIGSMSLAWFLALAVNAMPIVIAVIYGLLGDRKLEPQAEALKHRVDGEVAP